MKSLSDFVHIERRFARSARLDADLKGTPPIVGYILQASTRKALENLSASQIDTQQGAFTWTGPYGGGKSSTALLVGNLVGGSRANRQVARELAGPEFTAAFAKAFPERGQPWVVIPITGSRSDLRKAIASAAGKSLGWTRAAANDACRSDSSLVALLNKASKARSGVFLLIDELGKFLEHAIAHDGDIHLLQELAEFSSRSDGRFVVVGILHQAFDQYAGRLSRVARQEWAKVQGRFQDISFLAGADETVALLGRAIVAEHRPTSAMQASQKIAAAVAQRRPTDTTILSNALAAAWPLNPITALLLGPLSRHRFAQNERSVFGFLTSSEPYGFTQYLKTEPAKNPTTFGPPRLWDYLSANFGMALASGADGSLFSLAFEAIERAAAKGNALHVALTKSAALIEFFRNGTGLSVSATTLEGSVDDANTKAVASAINDLVEWAVLIQQPRLGGYAMFAGSDFDLDAAIERTRSLPTADSFLNLPAEVGLGFAVAKRHYFRTGALRAFEIALQLISIDDSPDDLAKRLAQRSIRGSGLLVLLLSDASLQQAELDRRAQTLAKALDDHAVIAAVAAAPQSYRLRDDAIDLQALSRIEREYHQLQGDRIARRQVTARRSAALDIIQSELTAALHEGRWWLGPDPTAPLTDGLAAVATKLADVAYPLTPILCSELVQRDRPSSNAMAAVRDLAYAMVRAEDKENLSLAGYPAEMGLYLTLLRPTGLHRRLDSGRYGFAGPDYSKAGKALMPVWKVLKASRDTILADIYAQWGARPYGLKRGPMPILALAYILSQRDRLAAYVDGLFQTDLDTFFVDKLLQNPASIRLKTISRSLEQTSFLADVAAWLGLEADSSALRVAQRLFQNCHSLPLYAQRTTSLSARACAVRDHILKADDPEALLFNGLTNLPLGADPASEIVDALTVAAEAYPHLLAMLREALARTLGADPETFAGIGDRAKTVIGLTNDLRFDAFAVRVASFEKGEDEIEGLASLLIHKPPRTWSDRDREQALLELARFGRRFREMEALATVRGRRADTEALAVIVGLDATKPPLLTSFELTSDERKVASRLAQHLLKTLGARSAQTGVRLAALARAVASLASEITPEAL